MYLVKLAMDVLHKTILYCQTCLRHAYATMHILARVDTKDHNNLVNCALILKSITKTRSYIYFDDFHCIFFCNQCAKIGTPPTLFIVVVNNNLVGKSVKRGQTFMNWIIEYNVCHSNVLGRRRWYDVCFVPLIDVYD